MNILLAGGPDQMLWIIKIKFHSKLDAREQLGKNLRLLADTLEASGA